MHKHTIPNFHLPESLLLLVNPSKVPSVTFLSFYRWVPLRLNILVLGA